MNRRHAIANETVSEKRSHLQPASSTGIIAIAMCYSTLKTMDVPEYIRRGGIASAIVAVHAAVLYGGLVISPDRTSSAVLGPVTARFVETSEPQPQWEPPSIVPQISPPEVRLPAAPAIELPAQTPAESRAVLAKAVTPPQSPALPPPSAAPRLVSTVEYVREPLPRYPPQSRRLREQGLVVLRVLIDEKGQACDIEIESSSGHERLDRAAKEAVTRAAFRPYVENGAPRRALVLIPIEFSLSSGAA